ncbi:protein cueball-like [Saccostrea echinata]|uniref:protein cueball-like n=1 Tax=Saccostrea echinata TaxID=191078 RepID=UPI002A8255C5|nr:protein cueball-like [Saccostrea echinata]
MILSCDSVDYLLRECDDIGETTQCPGNTECTLGETGFGECECPPGVYGEPECIGICETTQQCNFGGDCLNGKCECFPEFEGERCEAISKTTTSTTTTTTITTTERPRRRVLPLVVAGAAAAVPLLILVPALAGSLTLG